MNNSTNSHGLSVLDEARNIALSDEWRAAGLFLNPTKTARHRAADIREGRTTIRYLGSYIGTVEGMQEAIMAHWNKILPRNQRILHLGSKHLILAALRLCCSTKFGYLFRTIPWIARKALLACWITGCSTTCSPSSSMPAMTIYPTVQDVSPASPYGLVAAASFPFPTHAWVLWRMHPLSVWPRLQYSNGRERRRQVNDSLTLLHSAVDWLGLLRDAGMPEIDILCELSSVTHDQYWEDNSSASLFRGLQRTATGVWARAEWNKLLMSAPDQESQFRLVDCASKIGRAWLYIIPTSPFNTLSNVDFQLNLRYRLNVSMRTHANPNLHSGSCPCAPVSLSASPQPPPPYTADHAFACHSSYAKAARNKRHTKLKYAIARIFRDCQCTVQVEMPVTKANGSPGAMDVVCTEGTDLNKLYIDATCVSKPSAPAPPITQEQLSRRMTKLKAMAMQREERRQRARRARDEAEHLPALHMEAIEAPIAGREGLNADDRSDFQIIFHPERAAAVDLLIRPLLSRRAASKRAIYAPLHAEPGCKLAPFVFSSMGTSDTLVDHILQGLMKRKWSSNFFDNTGMIETRNARAASLSFVYSHLSLLFARCLRSFIPWGHHGQGLAPLRDIFIT